MGFLFLLVLGWMVILYGNYKMAVNHRKGYFIILMFSIFCVLIDRCSDSREPKFQRPNGDTYEDRYNRGVWDQTYGN